MSTTSRRSANWHPTVWDHDLVHSVTSNFNHLEEYHQSKHERLKMECAELLLPVEKDPVASLRLIDVVNRLGIAYHFDKQIKEITLKWILDETSAKEHQEAAIDHDLFHTSLKFRLSREYGFDVSSDVFKKFLWRDMKFDPSLAQDVNGLLSLYEASYLAFEGDHILDEANSFATTHLKAMTAERVVDPLLLKRIKHALDVPTHWRAKRIEARYFIDDYAKEEGRNELLLEFAKLDFNMLQSVYQCELKELSRWWNELAPSKNLEYVRDRLVECFLWALGSYYEMEFSDARKIFTKLSTLIVVLDDVYDIHASLDEAELFTQAFQRWDLKLTEGLPDSMKLCYSAIVDIINDMASFVMQKHGWDVTEMLKEEWIEVCGLKLHEATCYYNGHKPTLEEHLKTAWVSIGVQLILLGSYLFVPEPPTKEAMKYMKHSSKLMYWSCTLQRLCNDIATGKAEVERGDAPPSMHCFMHHKGASEEEALEHLNILRSNAWKAFNKEYLTHSTNIHKACAHAAFNVARSAHFFYEGGIDGFGISDGKTKEHITSLFMQPIID